MKPKKDNKPKISFSCIYKCRRCNETFTNGMVTIPIREHNVDFLSEMMIDEDLERISHKTIIHKCEGLREPIYGVAEFVEFKPY